MSRTAAGMMMVALMIAACSEDSRPPTSPTPQPVATVTPPPPAPPAPPGPAGPPGSGRLAGEYTLDLALGAGCAALPEPVTRQRFSASIGSAASGYLVTLSGPTFLAGSICTAAPSRLACNQFIATEDGDSVRFDLINENDDGHGGHIVAQVSDGTWIELVGSATGRLDGSTVAAQGSVHAWYCSTSRTYPFPCSEIRSCDSELTLTFTKH